MPPLVSRTVESWGLGAEIGISTTRLHAYGPMGLESLVTEKFVIVGDGQIRVLTASPEKSSPISSSCAN